MLVPSKLNGKIPFIQRIELNEKRIVGWEWGLIDLFWLLFLHYHDDDPKMFGFLSRKKIFDFQQLSENKKWMGKKGCS